MESSGSEVIASSTLGKDEEEREVEEEENWLLDGMEYTCGGNDAHPSTSNVSDQLQGSVPLTQPSACSSSVKRQIPECSKCANGKAVTKFRKVLLCWKCYRGRIVKMFDRDVIDYARHSDYGHVTKALVAFSGGGCSRLILHLLREHLQLRQTKQHFEVHVVHVDETGCLGMSLEKRREMVRSVAKSVLNYEFPLSIVNLDTLSNIHHPELIHPSPLDESYSWLGYLGDNQITSSSTAASTSTSTSTSTLPSTATFTSTSASTSRPLSLPELMSSRSLSIPEKESILELVRLRSIQQIAREGEYELLFFGDCATSIASKALRDVALGTGSAIFSLCNMMTEYKFEKQPVAENGKDKLAESVKKKVEEVIECSANQMSEGAGRKSKKGGKGKKSKYKKAEENEHVHTIRYIRLLHDMLADEIALFIQHEGLRDIVYAPSLTTAGSNGGRSKSIASVTEDFLWNLQREQDHTVHSVLKTVSKMKPADGKIMPLLPPVHGMASYGEDLAASRLTESNQCVIPKGDLGVFCHYCSTLLEDGLTSSSHSYSMSSTTTLPLCYSCSSLQFRVLKSGGEEFWDSFWKVEG